MTILEYAYEVDATSRIRCQLTNTAWESAGSYVLDGVHSTVSWLGPFEAPERDLLRVMAAILDVDRLSPRCAAGSKGIARELYWQRHIALRASVENPARWTAVSQALQELLHFMTDDIWELSFDHAAPVPAQQVLFTEKREPATEVALFSGGLDSAAGMYARSKRLGGRFVAVSACGNEVRGRAQVTALERLRDLGVQASWVKLGHQLRQVHRTRTDMEISQRSRGLLFLAMGAAVTSSLGLDQFHVYETGVGCLNLPISPAQVASRGTKAMHPSTLAATNDLLGMVLDRPVRVVVPFFFYTKAELCREVGAALGRLAEVTMSCDEGEGHKPNAMDHCGLCTSCLFRRIALFAAAAGPDPTRYRDVAGRRHGVYELVGFERHSAELAGCQTFADLLAIDPDMRFACLAPSESRLAPEAANAKVLEMYDRYRQEISSFFSSARPVLRDRPKIRKERERDLFAAVG
jgi:7-cyano-7-deazaguanine synthase in queuosine biosynthesis